MFKATAYYLLKYHANKKFIFGEVAKECYLTCKQKQLSQTISIKIQLPFFCDQHSAVPLPVACYISLTKLMVSHDFSHSTVAKQIVFDQRDSNSSHKFECAMNRRRQALVSKLETLDTITFT